MRILIALIALTSTYSYAAVSADTDTFVAALRVEGNWGFISYKKAIADENCSGYRVYVDLNSEPGKTAYSTAMAAFMADKQVKIRAVSDSSLVYGACKLYDIYVY